MAVALQETWRYHASVPYGIWKILDSVIYSELESCPMNAVFQDVEVGDHIFLRVISLNHMINGTSQPQVEGTMLLHDGHQSQGAAHLEDAATALAIDGFGDKFLPLEACLFHFSEITSPF